MNRARARVCRAIIASLALGLSLSFVGDAIAEDPSDVTASETPPEDTPASTAPVAPERTSPFFWTDNSLTILPWGWGFEVDPDEQSTFTFEHAHASKIGDLFMFVDVTYFHNSSSETNWYGEIGPRLSFGKVLDKDLSFVILRRGLFEFKDVLIAAQYERGDDADAAEAVNLGLGFDLDLRRAGFLGLLGKFKYIQLNVYARAQLADGREKGFQDMQVTMVAGYPVLIGPARFLVDGYFDWIVGIGGERASLHFNPQIKLDLGHFFWKDEKLYAGVELDFWLHKYQLDNSPDFNTNQEAVSLLVKYHF